MATNHILSVSENKGTNPSNRWKDEYWLMLLQVYMQKPEGIKHAYSRPMVNLSLEIHISPEYLYDKMTMIRNLDTPRIKRLWERYANNPRLLGATVKKLRAMAGFNNANSFYDGVEVCETFERDFRPTDDDPEVIPAMLIMILDLYFRLTPSTMNKNTPEVVEMSKLLGINASKVVEILMLFRHHDPYYKETGIVFHPLANPCIEVWQRYGNGSPMSLEALACQLKHYFIK